MERIAEILVNIPTRNINKAFSYMIPPHLDDIDVGWRVVVPFGNRKLEGFVIGVTDLQDSSQGELKPILDILDHDVWFDEHMMDTARWISQYYVCNLVDAMRLFIPGKSGVKTVTTYHLPDDVDANSIISSFTIKSTQACQVFRYVHQHSIVSSARLEKQFGASVLKVVRYLVRKGLLIGEAVVKKTASHRYKNLIRISDHQQIDQTFIETYQRKPAQARLLRYLMEHSQLAYDEFKKHNMSQDAARKLIESQVLVLEKQQVVRDSYASVCSVTSNVSLTVEQEQAFSSIKSKVAAKEYHSFLLHGITGSGKTQVYIEAVALVRQQQRQAIVLVPEIALTSQIVSRFKARFGDDVVVMHSKLSTGERYDAWQRLRTKQAGIVIGARSAIFAPLSDLGIVIMDEEHEFTYKQEETPRYHTRQVALKRAELANGIVIMGSATPSVETYYHALQGKHTLLVMAKRIAGASLPEVTIVDMREELRQKRRSVISLPLQQLLAETVSVGEQAIILLNRRGYATFVMCRECGHIVKCKHCDISLVYHAVGNSLRCHYCQSMEHTPTTCPACSSPYIRFFGTGTQKLEENLEKLFPSIRTIRMDQDTTSGKMAYDRILDGFAKGDYDVLLGTQMVAKGHDVKNVTAVGIIAADSILNLPDFRAAERVFALLTQAAGRAGRGDKPGKVVVQTYNPEHYAVQAGAHHDYHAFYNTEIGYRQGLGYPPYGQMIKITIQADQEQTARMQAELIIKELKTLLREENKVDIIGPFPAPITRVKDIFRMNILVKTVDLSPVKSSLVAMGLTTHNDIVIDVEPISIM